MSTELQCRLVLRQAISSSSVYSANISIPLGIIIGLLASFIQSLGLTIQRKSHVLNQFLPEHEQRVEHRRPLWLLGFAIFISSNIFGSFVQIASLPVVILAPLGAVSLLWNAFFARFILGDVFSPWMILGTILIAGGAVLIAVFGIVPEPTRSLEDLLDLFSRPTFVVYFSILGAVVLICLIITHITDYSFSRRLSHAKIPSSPSEPYSSHALTAPSKPAAALTTGLTVPLAEAGSATERTPLLDPKPIPPSAAPSLSSDSQDPAAKAIDRTRLLLAISYASFSGIISGMCLLFAKSGVELLLLTLRGQNQFWRWQAWVLVLGLIVFALLQLWYLHKALILADPTLVCPSAFCFYNLSSIVNGLVYFDQFSQISPLHLGLVVLGIFVLLGGVWVVSVQSGGKDVDIEAWSDSDEGDVQGIETGTRDYLRDYGPIRDEALPKTHGPYPIERETRSESNIYTLSRSPETEGLGLEIGPEDAPPPQSTVSQPSRFSRITSPDRSRILSSHGIHLSPPVRTRTSHRRRTTVDHTGHASSSQLGHGHPSYTPLSPPLHPMNTVSTLGSGFQIGLSPVSPGFAIVPRERGRRRSGLGFADVVTEATLNMSHQERQEQQRRRTVSEGDVRRRMQALAHDEDEPEEREDDGEDAQVIPVGKGKGREGRRRWDWLRKVFRS